MRFVAPAIVQLRRAQLTLILATLGPTVLMIAGSIVLLALGKGSVSIVMGVLLLALCATAVTGFVLASVFMRKGANLARVQNDFLSSVSHELRTPLTSIGLFISALRTGNLQDENEAEKCFNLLDRELERLDGLIKRLMDLSRIESGARVYARDRVGVADVVERALAGYEAASLTDPTPVQLELAENLEVLGDRDSLVLVLVNLLVNAWKHAPAADRKISLRSAALGKRVAVSVIDNGPGIPKDEQKRVFEQFERGKDALVRRTEGAGLGLAIARAIVRAHDGKLSILTPDEGGCELRIELKPAPLKPNA